MTAGDFKDITRQDIPEGLVYSWWSYRAADWDVADKGRRLDHIWATADIAPMPIQAVYCAPCAAGQALQTMPRFLQPLIFRAKKA